jgi:hypothetical protein
MKLFLPVYSSVLHYFWREGCIDYFNYLLAGPVDVFDYCNMLPSAIAKMKITFNVKGRKIIM